MLEQYRERPDPSWERDDSPEYNIKLEPEVEIMDVDRRHCCASSTQLEAVKEEEDILGDFEQALTAGSANGTKGYTNHSRSHSRASSVVSNAGERIMRPVPLVPIRDGAQEDILAALGVTGSPKMVYQTPGPAVGAPDPRSRQSSVVSDRSSVGGGSRCDIFKNGYRNSELDATPRANPESRKRSYGDF